MDIIVYLSKYIPPTITVDGKTLMFQIYINHPHYDIRFCYDGEDMEDDDGYPISNFKYLYENISSQDELLQDLKRLRQQLKEDGHLEGDYLLPGGYSKKLFDEWTNKSVR